ncbi:MAG: MFS transporter [bacterium]|nr:MFS transporter [bacterium]
MKLFRSELYNATFFVGFFFNLLLGMMFSNNALFPIYIRHIGGGADAIGFFWTALTLASFLCRPVVGSIVEKIGVKPVLMVGALLMGLPSVGYWVLLDHELGVWIWVLRMLQGVGWGCHNTAFFTLAAQAAPPGRRTEAISMYALPGLASNMVGPLLGEYLITHYGLPPFLLAICSMGVVAFLLISQIPLTPKPVAANAISLAGFYTILRMPAYWFAFSLAMLHAVCFASLSSFLAPVAAERNIAAFSLFFTAFSMGGIAVRLAGKSWADRQGLLRVAIPCFSIYCLGLLLLHFSWNLPLMILSGLICGSAHGASFPVLANVGYTLAPPLYRSTGIGMLTGMMDAGGALAGLVLGQVGQIYGYSHLFALSAIAPLVAVLLLVLVGRRALATPLAQAERES